MRLVVKHKYRLENFDKTKLKSPFNPDPEIKTINKDPAKDNASQAPFFCNKFSRLKSFSLK